MNPNELRKKRAEALKQAKAIADGAKASNVELTEEQSAKIDELLDEAEKLEAQAKKIEADEARLERLALGVADLEQAPARLAQPVHLHADGLDVSGIGAVDVGGPRYHRRLYAFNGPTALIAERDAYYSGRFLESVLLEREDPRRIEAREWCGDHGIDLNVRSEQTGTTIGGGAATIPTQMSGRVIDICEQFGMMRRECYVQPMDRDAMPIPRRISGLTGYWVGDKDGVTQSQTGWDNVNLVAKELCCLTRVPFSLMGDSIINWADRITLEMGRTFAEKEDDAGINGDGTSTYGGIVGIRTKMVDGSHAASYVEATAADDTFAELLAADLILMLGKVPDYAGINEKWYGSKLAWSAAFVRLMEAAGGNTMLSMAKGVANKQYLGYEYVSSPKMPKVTTSLDAVVMLLFGDISMACTFGDRSDMTIRTSDQRYFEYRQLGILASERVDIVAHDLGDDTNPGPLVGLIGNVS